MSRRFYFGSASDSDDDGGDALPYPEPLSRNAFLTPDFTPTGFLSSLRSRHQTLEDLRTELRTRSQELSKELLDLVNDNYQEFLGLGNDLRGGDDKIEEVRVGLLGFKREVDALKDRTSERRKEVEDLVRERRAVARSLRVGKDLLEIDSRLSELEGALEIVRPERQQQQKLNGITGHGLQENAGDADADDDSSLNLDLSDDDDDDYYNSDDSQEIGRDGAALVPLAKLTRRIGQLMEIRRLANRAGKDHPFVVAQQGRMDKVKDTLLLDLASALRQCQTAHAHGRTLKILKLYAALGETSEAVKVAKADR